MVEVSPCKGCDNELEDKNTHPDCIRCIDEGVPWEYAKGIKDRYTNNPEVVVKNKDSVSGTRGQKIDQPVSEDKIDLYIKGKCKVNGISFGGLMGNKRSRSISHVRKKIAKGLRDEYKLKNSEIAKALNISGSSVCYLFKGGRKKKRQIDDFPGRKPFQKMDPETIGKDVTHFDFKSITIEQLLSQREGLIDRVIKEAEWDLRTPENQILFYIWSGVEKGCR